jgi:hypothetical protein
MASRFWVGGSAAWDATVGTKWATTSGGAGGASVPIRTDDVFFDALSSGICTVSASSVALSINCTGFTGTISHPAATTLTIGDNVTAATGAGNIALKLVSGMTYTLGNGATSAIAFVSTSTTVQTLATGTKTLGNLGFTGSGAKWQLTDTTVASTVTLTTGSLDTNGQACTWVALSSTGTNTRALTLGASVITLSGSASWSCTSTGMTFTTNTSIINPAIAGTFAGGGLTYNTVQWVGASVGQTTISGSNTFANLKFVPTAGSHNDACLITSGTTQTITTLLTVTGKSRATQFFMRPTTRGSVATLNAAAVSLTNCDFIDITAAGVAVPFSGSFIGDSGGNTSITFTPAANQFWVGGTGNWTTTNSWASSTGGIAGTGRQPLPQDNVFFDAGSGTGTATLDTPRLCTDLNFTSSTLTTITTQVQQFAHDLYGSLTLIAGMTVTVSADTWNFAGRGTHTITTNGTSITVGSGGNGMSFNGGGHGTYTLQDDLTLTGTPTGQALVVSGTTFNANGHSVTLPSFGINNALAIVQMGTGTWTINGTTGTLWTYTAGTLTASTSSIVLSDAGSSAKTFAGGGATYSNVSITAGGTGAWTFTGSSTFSVLTINAPKSVVFTSSTTNTFSNFIATGSIGNIITITASSTTAGTLSKSSGIVSCDYLSLTNSTATGGAGWYAGNNSTNVSGNTGWNFHAPWVPRTVSY